MNEVRSLTSVVDVAVIGGGCAGLWLAHELSLHQLSCTIIDQHPFGGYASTRNQGWLQSGALYVAFQAPQTEVASECKTGYEIIRQFAPDALLPDIPCFFLFDSRDHLMDLLQRCRALGIYAKQVSRRTITRREPLLQNTPLEYAAQVRDCPVDSRTLLQRLAVGAARHGTTFLAVPALHQLRFDHQAGNWSVYIDHKILESRVIVLTCGAYIPEMLKKLVPRQEPHLYISKIAVLVLHAEVAGSMLITPRIPLGPNLVPFSRGGSVGATLCLVNADRNIASSQDFTVPPQDKQKYADQLAFWYPGIKPFLLRQGPIPSNFYVCQKLQLSPDRLLESRKYILINYKEAEWGGISENLITFYPGKFTSAPVGADHCAQLIQRLIRGPVPEIANQKYYDQPTSRLFLRDDQLTFEDED